MSEQYIVARSHGDWTVSCNGSSVGRFASCPRAIRAAVEAASELGSQAERGAEVVVERSHTDRYTVWVRGKDGLSH